MLIDVPLPKLPETPEGKRAFIEGMVHATELIQVLLAKSWLLGRESVDLERVRTECEGIMLTAAEIVRMAQAQERSIEIQAERDQDLQQREAELLRAGKLQP